jgi:hypothetical protein
MSAVHIALGTKIKSEFSVYKVSDEAMILQGAWHFYSGNLLGTHVRKVA